MKRCISNSAVKRGLTALALCLLIAPAVFFTGCLHYANDHKYEPSAPSEEFEGTAYDYIRSRSEDKFSLWYEAIEAGEMKSFYEQEGKTYFLLEDDQMATWMNSWHYSSISKMPNTAVKSLLTSYTVPGVYNSIDLSTSPIDVTTCDDEHIMRMRLYPNASTASQNLHSMQAGWVNNDGTVDYRGVISSNIKTSNGIIHVLNSRLLRK